MDLKLNLTAAGEKACAASFFACSSFMSLAAPQIFPGGGFAGRQDEITQSDKNIQKW
jgi:hypothetical protein